MNNSTAPIARSNAVNPSTAMIEPYTTVHTRGLVIARPISALPVNVVSMLNTCFTNS